ncbi:nucleotidyltransferase family protein [Sphingomonas sp. LY54]|uniref:nucleotidyltransferase family protein n=1 Tax=Sphingomonas sp. LY54 TaxID=3095343 RepID=UPI002D78410F|nr:nucleotidyltransferase family protein [Sphingomonas sp. LY54]WRP28003.1 nucleotidyltransferase family protein [Sphingomonas sp. LY54]
MTEPAKAAVREAAAGVDWDRFLAVLARHRIEGLAHHALTAAEVAAPPAQAAALARSAADILRKNLEFAAEAVRIDRAFAALPHLFVKGSTLAMLAYGTLALKGAWDIDILVSPETIAEAGAILADMGYICVLPAEPEQTEAWLRYVHETVWAHPTRGYAVELHSRLNDNPEMMPGVGLGSPRQRVQVGGGASLETLAQPVLFVYLCAHAARHAFSRLKWLADIAAFTSVDGVSADDLHSAAEQRGARRCSGTALLLADQVIGTPVDARLLARLREDPVVRGLAWTARWVMDGGRDGTASCDGAGGRMLARKASYIFLASGWRYWARELLDRAVFPYTPAYLKVPAWLRPGYTLLRMPWWLFSRRT